MAGQIQLVLLESWESSKELPEGVHCIDREGLISDCFILRTIREAHTRWHLQVEDVGLFVPGVVVELEVGLARGEDEGSVFVE